MRRSALVPVLLAALGLAGCGTTGNPPGLKAAGAPSSPGAMSIGITEGRLGGAITDTDSERERELSKARPIDPRVLRPVPNVREGVGAADQCANADLLPDPSNLATISAATLCLLNAERADRGLTVLNPDGELQRAALGHGKDMIDNGYFAHDGRDGSKPAERIRAAGYLSEGGSWRIGENLAWGTGELASPRAIMAAWMGSPGHRANILLPAYREVGFGVVAGNPRSKDGSGATFVTEFGVVQRSARSASRRTEGRNVRRVSSHDRRDSRSAKRRAASRRAKAKARMRARRSRARIARIALSPRSRRGRVVGRVSGTRAGLR
jgi:uncharacterized protein YkwD